MTEFISIILGFVLFGFLYVGLYIYFSRQQERAILQKVEAACAEKENSVIELSEIIEIQKNVILDQKAEINSQNIGINRLKETSLKVESQKKSSEVRLGLMAENFMPFIRDYPYDHKQFRFLANPVDGIQVNPDSIVFVEFKTGGAKLSCSQKHIKKLVAEGKVRFETFRVDEDGTHLKLESNMADA